MVRAAVMFCSNMTDVLGTILNILQISSSVYAWFCLGRVERTTTTQVTLVGQENTKHTPPPATPAFCVLSRCPFPCLTTTLLTPCSKLHASFMIKCHIYSSTYVFLNHLMYQTIVPLSLRSFLIFKYASHTVFECWVPIYFPPKPGGF